MSTGKMAQAVAGGLIGVTATKIIPTSLPPQFTSTPTMLVLSSVGSAWVAGWIAGRFDKTFGDAVMFGGFMQAGSVLLNAFLPAVGAQIGLQGLGDLVPGYFTQPENPITQGYERARIAAQPAPANNGMSGGLARAFGTKSGAF